MERCGARRGIDSGGWYLCVLSKGHTAPTHMDADNDTWRDDMGHCTVTNNEDHQCHLIPDHDGEHRFTSVRIACGTVLDDGPCAGTRGHRGDCTANADDIPSTQEPDQCPSTIGKPGEGEHENYIIVQCDGPPRHEGVHHNEEHKHAWNPEGYPPAEPDSLTGSRTEDIIREMADRVARLEAREFDARITRLEGRQSRIEEQPTLTELATSLGRIMERLNVVEENADRVVKIAENLRVRVPAAGSMRDTFAVTAMNNHLGKLIELLSERLPVPEPVTQPCAVLSPGSSTDRCERAAGHDGRHVRGTWTWLRGDGPQPCPATLTYGGDGPGYRCSLLLGHEGLHMDSDNDTWDITGL